MQIASSNISELHLTLEVAMTLMNELDQPDADVRATLDDKGFPRAVAASAASIDRLKERLRELAPLLTSLAGGDELAIRARINEELNEMPISPSIVEHDGTEAHMHWTASTATFDVQVIADILMALAEEIVTNGTIRFGRCGANDCGDLFYDRTRNRSRRFCDDPRCASRTHTADHRARQRS